MEDDDAGGVGVDAEQQQHAVGDAVASSMNEGRIRSDSIVINEASETGTSKEAGEAGGQSTDAKPDRPAVWGSASASNGVGTESEATAAAFAGKRKPAMAAASTAGEGPLVSQNQDAETSSGHATDSLSTDTHHQQAKEQQHSTVFGAVKHDGVQANDKSHAAAFVKPGDAAKAESSPPVAGSTDSIAAAAMRKKAAAAAAAAASPIPNVNSTGGENAQSIEPPEGYYLAAHVVTDPRDGLSYFATAEPWSANESQNDRHLEIPYQDCGYSGSTTQAIPLKSGHFRHLPPGVHPQTWTTATSTRSPGAALISSLISGAGGDSSDGSGTGTGTGHRKDPQLLVVLKPLELTVSGNGGESRRFQAGDCVLLEDTVGKGHKLSPIGGEELSVLMLALPRHHHAHHHHYHHYQKEDMRIPPIDSEAGEKERADAQPGIFKPTSPLASAKSKDSRHLSVLGLRRRGINKGRLPRPCRVPLSSSLSGDSSVGAGESTATFLSDGESVAAAILGADGFLGRRRALIGTIGFGLSAFTAYFLAQVAPWVLGLVGLLSAFVGGTIVFDGLIGAVWTEVSDLVEKIKAGSLLIDEEEQDDADDDDISSQQQ